MPGGVISPLLANIALDGFENLGKSQKVETEYTHKTGKNTGKKYTRWSEGIRGIRYADDAIFILKPGTNIQNADIDEWLAQRGLQINEAKTKVSKATDGFDFLGWHHRADSRGRFKSTPDQDSYRRIKEEIKRTWENTGVPDKSGKKRDTESRLKAIGSKIRGWRNYHRFCNMGKHNLWFVNQWLWKKLRKDKARTKQKEIQKLLSAKKAGTLAKAKAMELESRTSCTNKNNNTPQTPFVKGATKRILTNVQIETAFPPIPWKVGSHAMVKGTASPFDGNLTYWVNRKPELYADSPTGSAMTRQKMVTALYRR